MGRSFGAALLLLLVALASEDRLASAFTVAPQTDRAPIRSRTSTRASHDWCSTVSSTALCMSGDASASGNDDASAASTSKKKKKRAPAAEDEIDEEGEEDEEEEAKPAENTKVTALKEEITELEKTLAAKKSALQYALDQCEEYSKTGYARKVAEMENMRRVRSNIASSSASSATAGVLRNFLPVYDTLNNLNEKYADDEFGSKFSELNLKKSFANLGVTDFHVEPGEKVNNFRMKVLESETSKEFAKDTVIREVAAGIELNGNVIRAASCVTSSGSAEEENQEKDSSEEPAEE